MTAKVCDSIAAIRAGPIQSTRFLVPKSLLESIDNIFDSSDQVAAPCFTTDMTSQYEKVAVPSHKVYDVPTGIPQPYLQRNDREERLT